MTKKKARPNSFNSEATPKKFKTPERVAIEEYLLLHPGPHSAKSLASVTGYSEAMVNSRAKSACADGVLINTAPPGSPSMWQHRTHYRPIKDLTNLANRRNPITNAGMPNGSRAYWIKQMAAFNAPPRSA